MPAGGCLECRNVSTTVQIAAFSNTPTPNLVLALGPLIAALCVCPAGILCRCLGGLGQREKLAFPSVRVKNGVSREHLQGCVLEKAGLRG